MVERDARIDRLLLSQEITDFLYQEAELLDARRYRDWLGLLADDVRYWMPMRRNVKYGEWERATTRAEEVAWFDEDKVTLGQRVKQLQTGIHWAEEPVSRVCHVIS
ncbi:MAG: 3-phenylpropionate dioxygenase, partial [Alphaproteobacteria bacterium]|nr:3-phenylpropionate dioxygenase [Alphaproteobacteria bacterium]